MQPCSLIIEHMYPLWEFKIIASNRQKREFLERISGLQMLDRYYYGIHNF